MKKKLIATALLPMLGAVALAGPAHASTTVIRPGGLNTSDTGTAGHVVFRSSGLNVSTDNDTAAAVAAGYFPMDRLLSSFLTASLVWAGTSPQPQQRIVFDADGVSGNGNDHNVLVGEPTLHGDDWWLTSDSSADAKTADPSGPAIDSGSEWYGTLSQWGNDLPSARVTAGGFLLGPGAGSGVLDSVKYGGAIYTFSKDAAATVVNVSGYAGVTNDVRHTQIDMRSYARPAGTVRGARLKWRVYTDGRRAFSVDQGFARHDVWATTFAKNTGKHHVTLYKNATKVRDYYIYTAVRP